MALIGALNILLGMNVASVAAGSKKARSSLKGVETQAMATAQAVKLLQSTMGTLGIDVGVQELVGFLQSSVEAYREAEQQQKKLGAVLEATGHSAGFTSEQLGDLNSQLQKQTNYDDDAIAGAEAVLATFREIQGVQFTSAVQSMLDMSAVLGQDLQSSALQLGKALNDPVRGINALRRAGVSFTEEQQAQIKAMVAAGDVVGAQQVILAELKNEFGGAASAMRDELTGLSNDWGDLKEAIGGVFDNDLVKDGIKEISAALRDLATVTQAVSLGWKAIGHARHGDNQALAQDAMKANSMMESVKQSLSNLAFRTPLTMGFGPPEEKTPEPAGRAKASAERRKVAPAAGTPEFDASEYEQATSAYDALDKLTAKLKEEAELQGLTGTAREIAALKLKGLTDAELDDVRALAKRNAQLKVDASANDLVAKLQEEIRLFGLTGDALAIEKLRRQGASEAALGEAAALSKKIAAMEAEQKAQQAAADASRQLNADIAETRRDLEMQIATFGMSANEAKLYELALREAANAQALMKDREELAALEQQREVSAEARERLAALDAAEKALQERMQQHQQNEQNLAGAKDAAEKLAQLEAEKKALEAQQKAMEDLAAAWQRMYEETRTPAEKLADEVKRLDEMRAAYMAQIEKQVAAGDIGRGEAADRIKKVDDIYDRSKKKAEDTFRDETAGKKSDTKDVENKALTRGSAEAFHAANRFQNPVKPIEKQTLAVLRQIARQLYEDGKAERKKKAPKVVGRF